MKWIKQYDSMDCGPTCLAMVCKYYKKNIAIQILRDKTQIGKEGVNLLGISEAAESIGFRTKSVRLMVLVANNTVVPAVTAFTGLNEKQIDLIILNVKK